MPAATVAPHPVEPKGSGRAYPPMPAVHSPYSMSRSAFWLMLRRIAVIAAFAEIMFLVLFLALGLPLLAWINVVRIGMYGAAYWLIGQRRNRPAVVLMWTEMLLHAIACTLLLGWVCGAHYFLLVFIPAIALNRSPRQALGALAF